MPFEKINYPRLSTVVFVAEIFYNRSESFKMTKSNEKKVENPVSTQPNDQEEKFWLEPGVILDILPIVFHKLKNKLTPILGYSQILKASTQDSFQVTRLQKIENAALELTESMNTLKSNLPCSKKEKSLENINSSLERILEEIEDRLERDAIRIEKDFDDSILPFPLFPDQFRILIHEIIDNARHVFKKASKADPVIRISTKKEESSVIVSIHDNGPGLTETEQDQIWLPFFTTQPGRAGLGMVMCEKILSTHSAEFAIRSEPDQYCEFIFKFPFLKQ